MACIHAFTHFLRRLLIFMTSYTCSSFFRMRDIIISIALPAQKQSNLILGPNAALKFGQCYENRNTAKGALRTNLVQNILQLYLKNYFSNQMQLSLKQHKPQNVGKFKSFFSITKFLFNSAHMLYVKNNRSEHNMKLSKSFLIPGLTLPKTSLKKLIMSKILFVFCLCYFQQVSFLFRKIIFYSEYFGREFSGW